MAALETIRTKFGIGASLIIAFGLLLFLVNPSDIIQTIQSTSTKYDVGKINGKRISYTDFDAKVKEFSEVREMITGSSAAGEEIQRQTRESAWQDLVNEYLVVPTIENAGVRVGKEEMVDLFAGENISPVLLSMGIFNDENGEFSTDVVREFMENAEADQSGRGALLLKYLQNAVRSTRLNEKYYALFSAGGYVNSLETRRAIEENNTVASVDFVMAPNNYYPQDSSVVVSNADIKKYYKAHKENYKQNAARDIEYVVYEVKPSTADIAAQSDAFTALYDDFASAENVRAFLQQNSDRQWSDTWYKDGDLRGINREVDEWVSANKSGVSPVFTTGDTFFAARIMENAAVPDSVYVRHILLQGTNARHLADSLLPTVKKNSFAALATLYSVDKGNADGGEQGNIGWMSQRAMIPGFEPVMSAKIGQPFILNTQYGTHIVEVTKATKGLPKKKVAIFEKKAIASQETSDAAYHKASVLAVRADGKYDNYKAVCDSTGVYSHSLTINEGTESYGGISHAKEVTRWAFDNKPGKVSGIITVDNNYFFVVAVKAAKKEGYTPLADVSDGIRNQLYRQQYSEYRKEQVAADIEGLTSLEEIAEKLGTTVSKLTDVSFSTNSAPSTEPAFVGAVAAAQEGEITGPVAGIMGTYVFQVNGRETGAFYTEDDARKAQDMIENYHQQMLLPLMMEGTVKDNRARFY